jgi:hypothetical protein
VVVVVTGGEQSRYGRISVAVKREITQGLQEGHGLDKGISLYFHSESAIEFAFACFETWEEIDLRNVKVRCIAC